MYIHKLPNAAASKPVVTSSATALLDLIATAASAAHGVPGTANAVDIIPEDGDIRLLMDGNTPTAANGVLLKQGMFYALRNIPLTKLKLIRTGGSDVTCSVQVGQSEKDETSAIGGSANNVSLTVDSEFPAAATTTDGVANPSTTNVKSLMHGLNGSGTWDRIKAGITTLTATLTGFLNALPWAVYNATPTVRTEGQGGPLQADSSGSLNSTLATKVAGEDITNDRMKVEHQYSGIRYAADQLVKSGAGFLHSLTFSCNDAAPTAGSIIVYDNTAESGTILYSEAFDTTPFRGYSVILDVQFSTGLYIGFTTTADVNVTPSYR